MSDKRYQVFLSSTYKDLSEARQKVIQILMSLDCIPTGMEMFPAEDDEQWQIIKRAIDDSDYYLLIIAGRYGSTTRNGISYTEREYDYAVEQDIPVIALLNKDPGELLAKFVDSDPESKQKLKEFRAKVSRERIVTFWSNEAELEGQVATAVAKATKTKPRPGWVRADSIATEEALQRLYFLETDREALATKNLELRASLEASKPKLDDLKGIDDSFLLQGTTDGPGPAWPRERWDRSLAWQYIFGAIAPLLLRHPSGSDVSKTLARYAWGDAASLNEQSFFTVQVQLSALGLVKIDYVADTGGGGDLFWSLTPAGEQLMYELRAHRTGPNVSSQFSNEHD